MVKLVMTVEEKETFTEKNVYPVNVKVEIEEGQEEGNKSTSLELFLSLGIRKIVKEALDSRENVQRIVDEELIKFNEWSSKEDEQTLQHQGKNRGNGPDVIVRL